SNPAIAGTDVALTATILASGAEIPSGSVTFRDGGTVLGIVALDSNGSAVFHTSSLGVGVHVISVNYGGDSNVAAASASLTETVQSATTQVTLSASANPNTYSSPLTLTAVVSSNGGRPAGEVIFLDGEITLGSAILSGQESASLTLNAL